MCVLNKRQPGDSPQTTNKLYIYIYIYIYGHKAEDRLPCKYPTHTGKTEIT